MEPPFVIPLFIPHRGCPHDCLFCNQQEISGVRRQAADRLDVEAQIRDWLRHQGGRQEVQVAFYGGSFTCLPEEEQRSLLAAVQPFLDSGKVDSLRCSTRPDCLDDSVCESLRAHRVATVELGVQSLDDRVLQRALRGHSARDAEKAVRLLQKHGISVGVQLMVGLPAETRFSFLQTVAKTVELGPDFVRLYPCLVVKDSGLEKLYRQGRFTPLSLGASLVRCRFAWERFEKAGIPVVRMGLQPSKSLEKSILAGPYHPAFGELVRSRQWLQRIRGQLAALGDAGSLEVRVNPADMSAVVGQKRVNLERLCQLGFAGRFVLVADKKIQRGCVEYAVGQ
ncbi:MAG: radical SAM protein [Deltaproteobacteria bacterium]|nr:MAG: radical SAM protein [Desulfobacterales bacterium]PIE73768.1 MAG: radical SAM protein [Deltaproteobacteria bacterium]